MKYLIESETLKKLDHRIKKAVKLIKESIGNNPIIIRHHSDCDGYTGAVAIETAIDNKLISRKKWHYLKRSPSRAPYYEYRDAFWDISNHLKDISHEKIPLLLIMDLGSTDQSLFAIKLAKLYGFKVIVIDHHQPTFENGKAIIEKHTDVFINPYVVGGDSNLTAGMIGAEISRFIKKQPVHHLPAIAGIADMAEGKDIEGYLNVAKQKGYSKKLITSIARCIDFQAYYINANSKMTHDLLLSDLKEQKVKAFLIENEIKKLENEAVEKLKALSKISGSQKKIIQIDVSNIYRGSYPPQGKSTGLMFRYYEKQFEEKILVLGVNDSSITIRTNFNDFDVNELIEKLRQKLKHGAIDGGGHEVAGTIQFAASVKNDVLRLIKQYAK
ncbi:MAG: hypothetical protein MAG795_00727 [Candidatus Woesearchaeota archaeon]|nr:hypothetical protein [Candidatus Woesearchaeota archaeon]